MPLVHTQSFRSFFLLSFIQISAFFCYHEYSFFIVLGIFFKLYSMGCVLCSVPVSEWQCEEATYYTPPPAPHAHVTCARRPHLFAIVAAFYPIQNLNFQQLISVFRSFHQSMFTYHTYQTNKLLQLQWMLCQMRDTQGKKENKSECPTTTIEPKIGRKLGKLWIEQISRRINKWQTDIVIAEAPEKTHRPAQCRALWAS